MEEERRLCYVGMTRAMQKLYLLNASSRMLYNKVSNNQPSRFLSEVPSEFFDGEPEKIRQKQNFASAATPKKKQVPMAWEQNAPTPQVKNNNYDFEAFMQVEHEKFGLGVVLEVGGGVLTVDFTEHGVKKIVASFAPIKPSEKQ